MSWGITVADFNADGRDYYLVTRHSQVEDQIQLQRPDGSFEPDLVHFPGVPGRVTSPTPTVTVARPATSTATSGWITACSEAMAARVVKSNELWIAQPDGTYLNQAAAWGVDDPYGRGRRPLLFNFNHTANFAGPPDLYITNFGPRPDANKGHGTSFT